MKAVLVALAAFGATNVFGTNEWNKEITRQELRELDLKAAFGDWKQSFGREYTSVEEEALRFEVWTHNMHLIATHNSDKHQTFKQRMNQFGDLRKEEFKSKMLGYKPPQDVRGLYKKRRNPPSPEEQELSRYGPKKSSAPDSIDWTDHNGTSYVTPIKNQGDCGSCWAFSTTGSLECRGAIATGVLNSLSEQELVDCSDAEGNEGCDGGLMDDAFEYVKKEGGLCSEEDYPYKGRDGVCEASTCGTKLNPISSYTDVTKDDSSAMEDNVANGCVSIGVDASNWSFYSSGVYCKTCGEVLDHGVLVVGYGTDSAGKYGKADEQYWKVKNSWGKTWGMEGYILLCRNNDEATGECGMLRQPSYPDPKDSNTLIMEDAANHQ